MESTAAVLHEPTDAENLSEASPAELETIQVAEPIGEEVLVEITAASLCHTDLASARGHLEEQFPLVMGHEGTGIVRDIGDDVETVTLGDQVVFGRITCGRCKYCQAGRGYLCEKRTEARKRGTLRTGDVRFSKNGDPLHHYHGVSSFAEHTIVTEDVAIPITNELPAEQATLLGCGVFTGAGAVMNTADIEAGSSIVVFGAGGVGLSAVQGARLRSATDIIAVDIAPEKLGIAEEVGTTHTIDSSNENVVECVDEITDGGVDYSFEVVGSPSVVEQAVDCLAPTGQAVLVGVPPAGKQDISLDLYDIVVSEKDIVGSFNGSYSLPLAIPKLAKLAAKGDLRLDPLITDVKPLSELNEALDDLETGTGIRQVIKP